MRFIVSSPIISSAIVSSAVLLLPWSVAVADQPVAPPIINGESATIDDFPMAGATIADITARLGSQTVSLRMMMCSSTLIAPDVVMLAAHCVDEDTLNYSITMGQGSITSLEMSWTRQADLSDFDGYSFPALPDDAVPAIDWVANPGYDYMNLSYGLSENFDIGLVFLGEALEDIPLGYLPLPEEASQVQEDKVVQVVGWGQQVATNVWEMPPEGTYGYKQMGVSYIANMNDFELQIGLLEEDVRKCHGDSGGPSFMDVESIYSVSDRVVGVTSHSYDQSDCFETGGVDTRVDRYLDWIQQEMTIRCQDGTRVWCDEEGIIQPPLPEAADTADTADTGGSGSSGGIDTGVGGCSCSSAPSTAGGAAALLALLLALAGLRRP